MRVNILGGRDRLDDVVVGGGYVHAIPWLQAFAGTRASPHHVAHGYDAYKTPFYRFLRRVVTKCVENPKLTVGVTAAFFLAAMFGFTKLQQQFFPLSSRPELMIDIKMPEGSSFQATSKIVGEIERELESYREQHPVKHEASKLPKWLGALLHVNHVAVDDIQHYTSYTGAGSARFFLALNPDLPNVSFAKVVVQTSGVPARESLRKFLLERFAADATFAEPRLRVLRLDFGPPVGFPVQFRVLGKDREKVLEIATRVRDIMRTEPATVDVNLEWSEPSKTVRLKVDQDRARAMGLNTREISDNLQTLLTGVPIAQYRERTESVAVVARAIPEERLRVDEIPDLTLLTGMGRAVPLSQVANVSHELAAPILWRRNQKLC